MYKQPVILEDKEKVLGKNWQHWQDGIEEAINKMPIRAREFNDQQDQRAYDYFRKHFSTTAENQSIIQLKLSL